MILQFTGGYEMKRLAGWLFILCMIFTIPTTMGCGAVFNGAPQSVKFTSDPNGAEVWVDGDRMGKTPIELKLSKKDNHKVTFKMADKSERTYFINKKVKAGYIILDVIFGVVPVVIDAVAGSWYGLDDDDVHGALTEEERSDLLQRVREKNPTDSKIIHAHCIT
jgi:hypothetical protein